MFSCNWTSKRIKFRTKNELSNNLTIIKTDSVNDIALLRSESILCEIPIKFDREPELQIENIIFYLGFDQNRSDAQNKKTIQVNLAKVSAQGEQINKGGKAKFIEFEGVGIPGYSGGPVFDGKENLIAIMREARSKKEVKGHNELLINRAFLLNKININKLKYGK